MPGPVSDSYDPEWGTSEKRAEIDDAMSKMYLRVSDEVLSNRPPMYIGELVHKYLPLQLTATFSEKEWRIVRFALERARESL